MPVPRAACTQLVGTRILFSEHWDLCSEPWLLLLIVEVQTGTRSRSHTPTIVASPFPSTEATLGDLKGQRFFLIHPLIFLFPFWEPDIEDKGIQEHLQRRLARGRHRPGKCLRKP